MLRTAAPVCCALSPLSPLHHLFCISQAVCLLTLHAIHSSRVHFTFSNFKESDPLVCAKHHRSNSSIFEGKMCLEVAWKRKQFGVFPSSIHSCSVLSGKQKRSWSFSLFLCGRNRKQRNQKGCFDCFAWREKQRN